jgi:hypothetical protein
LCESELTVPPPVRPAVQAAAHLSGHGPALGLEVVVELGSIAKRLAAPPPPGARQELRQQRALIAHGLS